MHFVFWVKTLDGVLHESPISWCGLVWGGKECFEVLEELGPFQHDQDAPAQGILYWAFDGHALVVCRDRRCFPQDCRMLTVGWDIHFLMLTN